MKTETLNIAILPSDEVATQAIAMSKKIANEVGSEFTLNLDRFLSHITVYQAQYPRKNMNKVRNIVRSLSSEQELFEIKFDAITVSHGTFLFWNCYKSLILKSLQRKAVELANPLREGLIPNSLADVGGLSEGDAEKVIKVLSGSKSISFKPKSLILGYLGEHGTVTGIVENFRFKWSNLIQLRGEDWD